MAQVTVIINNRRYDIACDDGEEAHLTDLAQYLDKRVNELTRAVGQIGDARLLVMASLLVADELSEANTELEAIRGDGKGGRGRRGHPRARAPRRPDRGDCREAGTKLTFGLF